MTDTQETIVDHRVARKYLQNKLYYHMSPMRNTRTYVKQHIQKKPAFYDYDRRFDYDYAIYKIVYYNNIKQTVYHTMVMLLYYNANYKAIDWCIV